MKKLLFAAFAASALLAHADAIEDEDDGSPMYRLGGVVQKPGSGKGKIVVLNSLAEVKESDIKFAVDCFNVVLDLPIEIKTAAFEGRPSQKKVKDLKADLAIFIGEDKTCEDTLLVSPESRWAYINVARLKEDQPTPKRLINRVQKEFSRAFALLCGAANSDRAGMTTGAVTRNLDLDRMHPVCLPLDAYQRVSSYLAGLGVTSVIRVSYQSACQEGWAPKPTNAVQRAIWDKVYTMPTKPIKIQAKPAK